MKIGLDFDGVISDCGRLKCEGAKKLYGIDIPPERFKTELVVGNGILTLEQYRYLQKQIYENRDMALAMLPVDGVAEFVPRLQQEGYDLMVVTSRNEAGCEIAKEWIRKQNLMLKLVGVGGEGKAGDCRGLDVYVDDDWDKLEPLLVVVPHLYLFSWGYNQLISIDDSLRVHSWEELYEKIRGL